MPERGTVSDRELAELNRPPIRDEEAYVQPVGVCVDVVSTIYELPPSMKGIAKKELVEKYGIDLSSLNNILCEYKVIFLVKQPPEDPELGNDVAVVVCPKFRGSCDVVGRFKLLELTDSMINARYQAAAQLLKLGLKTGMGFVRIGKKED